MVLFFGQGGIGPDEKVAVDGRIMGEQVLEILIEIVIQADVANDLRCGASWQIQNSRIIKARPGRFCCSVGGL